jgi:histidinol-phosphate phosphatase family protein
MKIVFVDRDGVINEYPGHFKYVTSWEDFRFIPRAKAGLRKLQDAGFSIFVISNQAGVAKKLYSQAELDRITANMRQGLEKDGIRLAGVFYCTHLREEQCSCRKPAPGLIEKALAQCGGKKSDLAGCFFIGESMIDVETGRNAGMKTIMVFSGREKPEGRDSWEFAPDFTAADLLDAASIVLAE